MKALMDAVAQVTSIPTFQCPYSQPWKNPFFFPGVTARIAPVPIPIQSAAIDIGGHSNIRPAAAAGPAHMADILTGQGGPLRKRNHDGVLACEAVVASKKSRKSIEAEERRGKRLEHNRLAAIESRRRKKHMVEELQRSVQFYTKANSNLKSQNADLESQLLIANQKILMNDPESVKVKGAEGVPVSAKEGLPTPPNNKRAIRKASNKNADASIQRAKQPVLVNVSGSSGSPTIFRKPSCAEMDKQAQQAQFAATQAIYKTMGYPAGAARVAASTFSQFVGQTGIVPGLSDAKDEASPPKRGAAMATAPTAVPQIKSSVDSPRLPLANKISPEIESEDVTTYIEALNQFAMQQAAAANAAAAAATAAIQAARLHNQLKNGSSASVKALPSLQFSFPTADVAWPFHSEAPYMKE